MAVSILHAASETAARLIYRTTRRISGFPKSLQVRASPFSCNVALGEPLSWQPDLHSTSRTESLAADDLVLSFEMKLPGGERAIVDIVKLRDYCLNPAHPRGRHKARVFASTLGLTAADADVLRDALLRAAREESATSGDADEYGERYTVDFDLARGDRKATIRSAWIIRRDDPGPRLTSCFVLLK